MVKLNYLKVSYAQELATYLGSSGMPTENRVLIISPDDDTQTSSGLIIPGSVKEGMPRKGVILTKGPIDECNRIYESLVNTGTLVTYGLYAGKELEFDFTEFLADHPDGKLLKGIIDHSKFTVLSLNEIIYVENNPNL